MDRGGERGPEANPAQFPHISALESSPKSTVTQLAVHDYRLLHQDHPAYSNDLTPSDCYLFWNLKSDNDGVRYPWWWMTQAFFYWRWKSLLFNALWRHKLQRRHIRNWLIRVRKGCTFHWCINCGKYCCLICRGRKLLGWPSCILVIWYWYWAGSNNIGYCAACLVSF